MSIEPTTETFNRRLNLDAVEHDLDTIIYISDGSRGSDKIARLLTATRTLLKEAREHREAAYWRGPGCEEDDRG